MSEIHEGFIQTSFLSKEDMHTAGRFTRLIESGPIPVMREQFRKSVDETLVSVDTALVTAHWMETDDDALCSSVALNRILHEQYPDKTVKVVFSGPYIYKWDMLLNPGEVVWAAEKNKHGDITDYIGEKTALICLDGNALGRFTHYPEKIEQSETPVRTLLLDHHKGTPYNADATHIETTSTSTAELIAGIYGVERMSPDVCGLLYLGMAGDTRDFTFKHTPEQRKLADDLLAKSGRTHAELKSMLQKSEKQKEVVDAISSSGGVKTGEGSIPDIYYAYLSSTQIEAFHNTLVSPDFDIAEAAKEYAFRQTQVKDQPGLSLTILPVADSAGVYKIAFRRRGITHKLNEIGAAFGGGGHESAAGGTYTLPETLQKELEVLKKQPDFNEMEFVSEQIIYKLIGYLHNSAQ